MATPLGTLATAWVEGLSSGQDEYGDVMLMAMLLVEIIIYQMELMELKTKVWKERWSPYHGRLLFGNVSGHFSNCLGAHHHMLTF